MSRVRQLLIVGAGGHGRSVAEALQLQPSEASGYQLMAFLDDAAQPGQQAGAWPVWGTTALLGNCRARGIDAVIVALGNNARGLPCISECVWPAWRWPRWCTHRPSCRPAPQ